MATKTQRSSETLFWQQAGLIILCIRFVQGFIFWGGGSRRFIYAPDKLDPHAPQWMANKIQSATPGALLDIQPLVQFLLQHFVLLYTSIILFSLVELFSGIALITGTFTRFAGFITALLSIMLMVLFGWEGGTCLDEWTMAVSNLAMGLTIAIAGGGVYSVDHYLEHFSIVSKRKWLMLLSSGPLPASSLKRISLGFLFCTVLFTLATYNYYRGAIFSRYHSGPVSPRVFHLTLSNGRLQPNGMISFTAYADAGTTSQPNYIMRMELVNANREILAEWRGINMKQPFVTIKNTYDYNRITEGVYGLTAPTSAEAQITLIPRAVIHLGAGTYQLIVFTIDGKRWTLDLSL